MRKWARVFFIYPAVIIASTADDEKVFFPARHRLLEGVQLGDIISFIPGEPTAVQSERYRVKWFGMHPKIIASAIEKVQGAGWKQECEHDADWQSFVSR